MTDYAERAFSHSPYSRDLIDSLPMSPWVWTAPSAEPQQSEECEAAKRAERKKALKKAASERHIERKRLVEWESTYKFPRDAKGRFLPKEPGQVWRPVNVVSQMQKLATRVNKETDWCAPTKFISTKARR